MPQVLPQAPTDENQTLKEPPAVPHLPLDNLSRVNASGSYELDKILKAQRLLKRKKRTKGWVPIYLVLRPNLLSIYRNVDETGLKHQVDLSEITAVALLPKQKEKHEGVFGIFTPGRNYYLDAGHLGAATDWSKMIRNEAHMENMDLPDAATFKHHSEHDGSGPAVPGSRALSSDIDIRPKSGDGSRPIPIRRAAPASESGNEVGSYSDFSDTPFGSAVSLSHGPHRGMLGGLKVTADARRAFYGAAQPSENPNDEARVVWHGYVWCLKAQKAVRRWRKCWAVLRSKGMALYKNEEEYSALLILPLESIVDAVDTEPLSKGKRFCWQVITEDRNYRFCASSEDELFKWLGAFKSVLARKGEAHTS